MYCVIENNDLLKDDLFPLNGSQLSGGYPELSIILDQ